MRITNKKQCPKCKSFNTSDIGKKWGSVGDLRLNGKYNEQDISINKPIYKCNDCDKEFKVVESLPKS